MLCTEGNSERKASRSLHASAARSGLKSHEAGCWGVLPANAVVLGGWDVDVLVVVGLAVEGGEEGVVEGEEEGGDEGVEGRVAFDTADVDVVEEVLEGVAVDDVVVLVMGVDEEVEGSATSSSTSTSVWMACSLREYKGETGAPMMRFAGMAHATAATKTRRVSLNNMLAKGRGGEMVSVLIHCSAR